MASNEIDQQVQAPANAKLDHSWVLNDAHPPIPAIRDSANQSSYARPGDHDYSLTVEGKQRTFEVHVPEGYDGKQPLPVMYVMGGVGGDIAHMKSESKMNDVADEKHFAVVYLQALPKDYNWTSWNLDHGSLTKKDNSYDDLNYIKAVMGSVGAQFKTDPAAQYITGFSEGGAAAQYVAEKMPHTFAGVGSIHGTHLESDPTPYSKDPTSFVSILGNDDNMLPYTGGRGWFDAEGTGWLGVSPIKGFMTLPFAKASESQPSWQAPLWARAQQGDSHVVINNSYNKTTIWTSPSGATTTEIIHKGNGPQIFTVPSKLLGSALGQTSPEDLRHTLSGGQHAISNGQDTISNHGWTAVGEPDPRENDAEEVATDLLKFRKPGK
jgi:predicted esterase